jgi:hypothetical protein
VQFLARVVDLLALANWQRSGKKRGRKPKPVPRPKQQTRIGSTPRPLDEMDALLGYSPRKQ